MQFLDENHVVVALSSQRKFEGNGDPYNHLYIPARGAPLAAVLPHATIVLPENPEIRELIRFLEKTLVSTLRGQMRVVWVSGKNYLLDDDITAEARNKLGEIVLSHQDQGRSTVVLPYCRSAPFTAWSDHLAASQYSVIGDAPAFIEAYGTKQILYPDVADDSSKGLFAGLPISLPRGFFCRSIADLPAAYDRLVAEGIVDVVVKPTASAAGLGIAKVRSRAELFAYNWHLGGSFVVEECLSVDHDQDGCEVSCSVQFIGDQIVGLPKSQLVNGSHWEGNVSPGLFNKEFGEQVLGQARHALKKLRELGMQGPGGFDFLSTKGKPYLVDPNLGRFTGAHWPDFIAQRLIPNRPWAALEFPQHRDIFEVWEILKQNGLALDLAKGEGGFPFCHLRNMWSMALAFAPTNELAFATIKKARAILRQC